MIVRLATEDDDNGIVQLMERTPMDGPVRIASGYRPSFFNALRVEGARAVVCVAEHNGQIVAAGSATSRLVFLNGSPRHVTYLGSLRIAPEARGSSALIRGYRILADELAGNPSVLTFTSIVSGNRRAENILMGGRAGMPVYTPFCACHTYLLRPERTTSRPPSFRISTAECPNELADYFNAVGQHRNFFPACTSMDFHPGQDTNFPGLAARDVLVARDGKRILGTLACWDTSSHRQTIIAGYAPWIRILRPVINASCRIARRPTLPPPGGSLPLLFGSLCLLREQDPSVFLALIRAAQKETQQRGKMVFALTLTDNDPLGHALARLPGRALDSTMYIVQWPGKNTAISPDKRPAHFEAAML